MRFLLPLMVLVTGCVTPIEQLEGFTRLELFITANRDKLIDLKDDVVVLNASYSKFSQIDKLLSEVDESLRSTDYITDNLLKRDDDFFKRMDEHEEAIEKLIGRLRDAEERIKPQKIIELGEKVPCRICERRKAKKFKVDLDDWNNWESWWKSLNEGPKPLGPWPKHPHPPGH